MSVFPKGVALIIGLGGAVALHSVFNYLIITGSTIGGLEAPMIIWSIGFIYILLIEGLRYLGRRHKRILYEEAQNIIKI